MRVNRTYAKKKECVNAPVGPFAIFLHCTYGYNIRNELVSATKNAEDIEYQYQYDDIGNRSTNSSTPPFISMSYDRMGRRVTKNNQRFVYDGYLQIANSELETLNSKLQTFIWDPAESVATRPLMIEKHGKCMLYVTHDGNKNVSDLLFFNGGSGVAAHYEYAPFGALTASTRNSTSTAYDFRTYNPFRFSSEYADDALGLVYYNYRHYEPVMGRWLRRDPVGIFVTLGGLYSYCQNRDYINDIRGLYYYLKGYDPYGYTSNVVIITPNCIEDKDSKCWILQAGSYSPKITVEDYGYYSLTNEAGRCFLAKCRRFDEDKKLTMQHEQEHVRIVQEAIDKANEILGLPKTFQSKTICEAYYKVRSEEWETPVVKAKRDQETHTGNSPTPTPITFYKEYDANRCEIKEVDCDK